MLSSHLDARARSSSFTQLTHYVRANPRPQWPPIAPRRTLMAAAETAGVGYWIKPRRGCAAVFWTHTDKGLDAHSWHVGARLPPEATDGKLIAREWLSSTSWPSSRRLYVPCCLPATSLAASEPQRRRLLERATHAFVPALTRLAHSSPTPQRSSSRYRSCIGYLPNEPGCRREARSSYLPRSLHRIHEHRIGMP